ncbi:MAG: three-Cys-motif partner protein TcmP [Acidobacteria bacterium]|nr:three-Cys-motif partner protein TcmP [Acidobacteriota bacterium]MBU4306603.1 three-Cys-motif partner protein TcmP [Acidobacteriota bacterium]MCG2812581.1 three-Cys-motif partner protein TcmP [Candidatus Aminicenantes bacterium]
MQKHIFGGSWTKTKLEVLRKYLEAYTKILSKKQYKYAYIDAFAGTGSIEEDTDYRELKKLFPEDSEFYGKSSIAGSAQIALGVLPPFQKYIFVESKKDHVHELRKLRDKYPEYEIEIINADANDYLVDLCENRKWNNHRAVLFLDPYGMQVQWKTYEAIAQTKAIDLWILFPLGIAINRLLKKDGKIDKVNKKKLDEIFGTTAWYEKFYQKRNSKTLFGSEDEMEKQIGFDKISEFFIERLKGTFPYVVDIPKSLYNSKNNPIFILCFAASNPSAGKLATKIANDILNKVNL